MDKALQDPLGSLERNGRCSHPDHLPEGFQPDFGCRADPLAICCYYSPNRHLKIPGKARMPGAFSWRLGHPPAPIEVALRPPREPNEARWPQNQDFPVYGVRHFPLDEDSVGYP